MKEQTHQEIVTKLLATKYSMEKTKDFASNTMRKVGKMNPLAKIRVLQLQQHFDGLKQTKGEPRKSAAVSLAKSLGVRSKSTPRGLYCSNCGAQLTLSAAFCASCGAKTKKPF